MMNTNKDTLPLQGLLNGIGQVYFTPSAVTSLLLLLAISIESIPLACLTILGVSCSYTLARYTHNSINTNNKPTHDLNSGMYALNGALIGLFIGNFFGVTPILAAVTVFGALLTVPIAKIVFSFKKYRGYTSAFVITSWGIYVVQSTFELSAFSTSSIALMPLIDIGTDVKNYLPTFVVTMLKGISQVSFINNEFSGLVILVAIALNSFMHAVWILLAVLISTLFSSLIGADNELIKQGLYGYNAILATLALVLYPRIPWPLILLGMLLSCLITLGFHTLALLPLTAPFILSTWAVVYLSGLLQKRSLA
ncbi:Urea transporter [Vibrio crassostreae]|nr:Urea transporter [Vibrio crassostreae]CAK3060210.1 Urea transporter [Vibrio crassostreae]CAK3060885.1 Urea transporter [Vibrio crassostreae]CAK3061609.1 Urea transporter [Vibrio crassostreae]CAK3065428.1 Urea transporter [Vibrio crassostreae]